MTQNRKKCYNLRSCSVRSEGFPKSNGYVDRCDSKSNGLLIRRSWVRAPAISLHGSGFNRSCMVCGVNVVLTRGINASDPCTIFPSGGARTVLCRGGFFFLGEGGGL